MKLFLKISILFFMMINLHAEVLDVNQLFNKKLVKVKQENIGTVKSFYGLTQIDETKIVDIVTRFDGFITDLNANKTLMYVKKNEPLFSIYSDKVLSIYKELQVSKKINQSLYQSSLDKLKALDIHSNEIQRFSKSKNVKDVHVLSPMNALILNKNINQGSFVKKGKQLIQLANIEKLWFIAQVYQKDLSFIQKDMEAKIRFDGITKTYNSKVDYIYPFVDKKRKTVDVRFVIDNQQMKLYPNMFAEVKLQNTKRTMLTLPKTAVLTKGDKYFVFKPVSKEEFEPVEIEAVRISSSKYEIIDGLKAGDEVVNNALFLLDSDAVTNGLYDSDNDNDW